jgi:molybdate transport repressor ModE-like protein
MNITQITAFRDWADDIVRQSQQLPAYDYATKVPNISTKQMLSLLALQRTGSFTEAAKQVGLSQPGFSRVIQRMEKAIGYQLVDRTGKGIQMTVEGLEIAWCSWTTLQALKATQEG